MLPRFPMFCAALVTATMLVSTSPASAESYTDWRKVSAGAWHTCAVRFTGQLYCWGGDGFGQLGDGPVDSDGATAPKQIGAATDWKSVSAGRDHTCGIRNPGRLYCWGDDNNEQLGNSSPSGDQTEPQQIGTATDWTLVSAGGEHTCGLRGLGKLYCWGNGSGQVGNGVAGSDVDTPLRIGDAVNWRTVTAGGYHTCATKGSGRGGGYLYCWGSDNYGNVGNGSPDEYLTKPQLIGLKSDWATVVAGDVHTCAIRVGALYCWGWDEYGQVGNGAFSSATVTSPTRIGTADDWKSVGPGIAHTCAIKGAGWLMCWGSDNGGQVGNGDTSTANRPSPQQISRASDWVSATAGGAHSCALREAGTETGRKLYCWGTGATSPPVTITAPVAI